MSEKDQKTAEKPSDKLGWTGAAAIAGAAIGSAAVTAALLFATRRKARPTDKPVHPEEAPETD